jgi:hypothetical protein
MQEPEFVKAIKNSIAENSEAVKDLRNSVTSLQENLKEGDTKNEQLLTEISNQAAAHKAELEKSQNAHQDELDAQDTAHQADVKSQVDNLVTASLAGAAVVAVPAADRTKDGAARIPIEDQIKNAGSVKEQLAIVEAHQKERMALN